MAFRPSQKNREFVTNSKGERVRNDAFVRRAATKHRAPSLRPTVSTPPSFDIGENASKVSKRLVSDGFTPMIVGGFVRDGLLGRESKDVDLEVFGADSIDDLAASLDGIGRIDEVGKHFGILKVTVGGETIDVAIPRREVSTGEGHRDFDTVSDSGMSFIDAARRRDFTINALMVDPMTGSIVDNFGGVRDINGRCLRMVDSSTFGDDPLRVFRAVRFSGQLDFEADGELVAVMSSTDISSLPRERIWGELEKVFASNNPSASFQLMESTGLRERSGFDRVPAPTAGARPEAYVAVMGLTVGRDRVPSKMRSTANNAAAVAERADGSRAEVLDAMVDHPVDAATVNDVLALRGSSLRVPRDLVPDPPVLSGHDVMAAGFSGPDIKRVLSDHRRAINRGVIDNRSSAEEWLRRQK